MRIDETPVRVLFKNQDVHGARKLILPQEDAFYAARPDVTLREATDACLGEGYPSFAGLVGLIKDHPGCFHPYRESSEYGYLHFPVRNPKANAVVVPGGGYEMIASVNEGLDFVKPLQEAGYSVYIAGYGIKDDACFPKPVVQLSECLREASDLPTMLLGFSAGGHLAATLSRKDMAEAFGYKRPEALILGYPVISFVLPTHEPSKQLFTGGRGDLFDFLSAEGHVDVDYPPTYLWRAISDDVVPIVNSDAFDRALSMAGVRHLYRVFPGNGHGWGMGKGTSAEGWLDEALSFLRQQ